MYNGLPYNNKLFDKSVTNEINTAFSKIQERVDDFKVADLQPKYEVKSLNTGTSKNNKLDIKDRSFQVGYEYWLDIIITPKEDVELLNAAEIYTTSFSVPFTVFFTIICTDSDEYECQGQIDGNSLKVAGKFAKDKEYIIVKSFMTGVK